MLIGLEPKLVILPYPDHPTTSKVRPVQKNISTISNTTKIKNFIDKVWVRERKESAINMFNSCDVLPVSFNSLEYAAVLEACEGATCVSSIHLSKINT